jgi:hypothetical protein
LRKTFQENQQEEEFEGKLENLELQLRVFGCGVQCFENETFRDFWWTPDDFKYFLSDKSEIKLGNEKLRNILLSKNEKDVTLLHEIIYYDANENIIEYFLEKIQKVLNKTEILSLIFAQESEWNETPLMMAARLRKLKNLKVFWNFLDENLNEDEKRKILLVEQKGSLTALHFSTLNKDPNSFLFIKEIYEKFFTKEEIREIFMKTHKDFVPFIDVVIEYASPETALEVSKYLENLFENQKIELRKRL